MPTSAIAASTGGCPDDAAVAGWVQQWDSMQPLTRPPVGLSYADALCGQRKVATAMGRVLGAAVGYTVGLTSGEAQRKYKVEAPARGQLLSNMLFADGARLPARFGAQPQLEADLMVRIGDAEAIHRAKSPIDAAAGVAEYFPFLKLVDAAWAPGLPPDYNSLLVANLGVRYGVYGRAFKMIPDATTIQSLGEMGVVVEGGNARAQEAKGTAVMTHPLWSLIWLARDLAAQGQRLKTGDLVTLGSFTAPRTIGPGQSIRLRYDGLPGVVPTVTVNFE